MKKINIAIKNKTKLVKELESIYDIEYCSKQSLFSKLIFKSKIYPDLYFHQGSLTKEALVMVENSKVIIVNAAAIKKSIIEKIPNIEQNKINIVYPYYLNRSKYNKQIKKDFAKDYLIDKNTRVILFMANDLALGGIGPFLNILSKLKEKNFKVIVESDSKQIEKLKLHIQRLKLGYQVILLDNYKEKDKLFIASDIFILPTKQKVYATNIIKAMSYKNAVFLPSTNYASEIIDTFSIMHSLEDPSTPFRIDALLSNKQELKQIQKQNYIISKKFSYESRFNIVKSIIDSIL